MLGPDRDNGEQAMQWDVKSCADAGCYMLVEGTADFIVHACCSPVPCSYLVAKYLPMLIYNASVKLKFCLKEP
jgi:hypothetical protein